MNFRIINSNEIIPGKREEAYVLAVQATFSEDFSVSLEPHYICLWDMEYSTEYGITKNFGNAYRFETPSTARDFIINQEDLMKNFTGNYNPNTFKIYRISLKEVG